MNSTITLPQAIQQRENILDLIYCVKYRDTISSNLNLEYWMDMLRSWDKEILEHINYIELSNLK